MSDNLQSDRWDRIQQRLRRSMLAPAGTEGRDERHRQAVYRQRAARLAAVASNSASNSSLLTQVLTFALGDQQYGIPLSNVVRIFPLLHWTPLPLAPPWLLGIASFDSHIRSVVDLRLLLETVAANASANANMVLIRTPRCELGAVVDRTIGVQFVDLDDLTAPEDSHGESCGGVVRGATSDGLMVICADALATRIAAARRDPAKL